MKDLSIIVVSYNTQKLLRDCLESVLANSGEFSSELIVIDNSSHDGSPEMVQREFPNVHLISNERNLGFAAANNQAIEKSEGRYILLLNSDTVVFECVLKSCVDFLDKNRDVGVLGCRVLNPDRSLQYSCTLTPSLLNMFLLTSGLSRLNTPQFFGRYQMRHWDHTSVRDVPVISGCYLMARTTAIKQVGVLDDAFFFFGEETDWCTRFLRAGWRVVYAPVGEIIHYGSVSAVSLGHKRDLLLTSGLVRYHRKHGGILPALVLWIMLFGFNLSRCILWTVICVFASSTERIERRNHFFEVVKYYMSTWPTSKRGPLK